MKVHSRGTHGIVIFASLTLAILLFAMHPRAAYSQSSANTITGYAWSDTIGWIDLNCANAATCATNSFGIGYASDGTLAGYAWSDNVGWISANSTDLAGCPTSPCTATLSQSGLSGWLKVLSANGTQTGGWDGWISLAGTGYSVTLSGNVLSGFAWGDTNVGWVDFSQARIQPTCTPAYTCTGAGSNTINYTDASCNISSPTTCTAPSYCSSGISICETLLPPIRTSNRH